MSGGVRMGASIATTAPPNLANGLAPERRGDATYAYQTTFSPAATAASRAVVVSVRAGESRVAVDVRLHPVRIVEVSGTLSDASGPVPNFGVHLMPTETGDGASVLEIAATATDGRGALRISRSAGRSVHGARPSPGRATTRDRWSAATGGDSRRRSTRRVGESGDHGWRRERERRDAHHSRGHSRDRTCRIPRVGAAAVGQRTRDPARRAAAVPRGRPHADGRRRSVGRFRRARPAARAVSVADPTYRRGRCNQSRVARTT